MHFRHLFSFGGVALLSLSQEWTLLATWSQQFRAWTWPGRHLTARCSHL